MVPARHTSALFISGFRSTTMRLLRRFRRAGYSSGARAEVLGVYHDSVKLLKDDAVLPSLQVRVVQASVQDTSMCILSSEESSWRRRLGDCARTSLLDPAAVAACCAGSAGTSWLQVLVVFTSFQDTRHISSAFLEFSSSVDLPVVLSLLYCLPSNKDFVRSLRLSLVYR